MKQKKIRSILLIYILIISITLGNIPTNLVNEVKADELKIIYGTLYINNGNGYESAEDGIEIKIIIENNTFYTTTLQTNDSNYNLSIPLESEGKTADFYVENDLIPIDNKSISIGSENQYLVNLHVDIPIENSPPLIPSDPYPTDNLSNVGVNVNLSWNGEDLDGDSVTYDIYYDTVSPPALIVHNQSAPSYNPETMEYGTTYYWKIVAWDENDAAAAGLEWHFTTEEKSNYSPIIVDIPDQTIDENSFFNTLNLDDYISDRDNSNDEITWNVSGNSDLIVTIDSNRRANITIPYGDWIGEETITFQATDPDGLHDEDDVKFIVNLENKPVIKRDDSDPKNEQSSNIQIHSLSNGNGCPPSCLIPDNLTDSTTEIISGTDLQMTLDSYFESGVIDVTTDQTQYQLWNTINGVDTVTLEFEFIGNEAGNKNVYGYYYNGDSPTFVGVFEIPNINGHNHSGYDLPVAEYSGQIFTVPDVSVVNLNYIGFAIDSEGDQQSHMIYSENSLNNDNDNTLVFSLCDDSNNMMYVTCFEDLISDSDNDYNDAIVLIRIICDINHPPELEPINDITMNAGESLTVFLNAWDPDEDTITLTTIDLPDFGELTDNGDGTGTIDFTPDYDDSGEYEITVRATDDNIPPLFDEETFNITVNAPCVSLVKTAESSVVIGGTIHYEYLIENCGDVTLYDVEVVDDPLGVIVSDVDLAPGESTTVFAEYVVVDGDEPSVSNSAVVTGYPAVGDPVSASDSWSVSILNRPPNLPKDERPVNNKENTELKVTLSVNVSDPDNDILNVSFYNADNDELIGNDSLIPSGNNASVTWSNRNYGTLYSWYVIVNDSIDTTQSETWNFTTKNRPSTGGSNVKPNLPPTANASESQRTGFIKESIHFDGSKSRDPGSGYIVNYSWDFGDGKKGYGMTTEHIYNEEGIYEVELTVKDDGGKKDTDIIDVEIIKANNPPETPTIDGPTEGHKDVDYEFTVMSSDADNDTIQYLINWGDGNTTTSEFIENGSALVQWYNWTNHGVYTISVKAYDGETESGSNTFTIWIDVWPIEDEIKGHLVDEDSSKPFDVFDDTKTGDTIDVDMDNDTYLIDIDEDGKKDYAFDLEEGLTPYPEYVYQKYKAIFEEEMSTPGFELLSFLVMLGIVMIILKKRKMKNKR